MIEAVSKDNIQDVLPLIRAYQTFYNVTDVSDEKNQDFFSQFGESNPAGCQFIFREHGVAVGFATVYFSYASSITAKVGVLNDLFTIPEYRGKGIGRQLIEHCHQFSSINGAARLQWVTAPSNKAAQKLYDAMETNKSNWCFYTYN